MNLLQFVEMSVAETLLLSAACLLVVFILGGIGALFVRARTKGGNRFCLQAVLGLSLVTVLTLIAASYCAFLAKYIIYISIAASLALTLRAVLKKHLPIGEWLRSLLPSLIVYSCFVALWLSYIFTKGGTVDYNPHMIYCSAIPEEIFKADYASRLRIIDVYPYEWSVYHLFNGCATAIPFAAFPLKNFVTFNLAKFAVVSVLIGAVYEGLIHRFGSKRAPKISMLVLFIFVIGANRFTLFSLEINNYSSLLLMGIVWLALEKEEYSTAAMLSTVLAVATSKSTITGFLFFAFSLYKLFKGNDCSIKALLIAERSTALYCVIAGIGCIVMVISGESPANEHLLNPDFMANAIHASWMGMFFFGDSLNAFINTKAILNLGWPVMMPLLYILVLVTQRRRWISFARKHLKAIAYATLLVASLYVMFWMQSHGDAPVVSLRFFVVPLQFLCFYILPLACAFSCCKKQMYTPLQLFTVFAFVQFMILNADNGASNYCLLMLPLAFYISECVTTLLERIPRKMETALYAIVLCGTIYYGIEHNPYKIFVWDDTDTSYWSPIELEHVDYLGDTPFEYYSPDDATAVKLHSLKGNRIHYNVKPNQRDPILGKLSMSMRFVPASKYEGDVL